MANDEPKRPDVVQLRAEWSSPEDLVALFCNVFAVQCIKSEFVITFGIATPPILSGPITQEEASKIVMKLKPVVRIGLTPERVVELIGVLQSQLRAYSDMELKN